MLFLVPKTVQFSAVQILSSKCQKSTQQTQLVRLSERILYLFLSIYQPKITYKLFINYLPWKGENSIDIIALYALLHLLQS